MIDKNEVRVLFMWAIVCAIVMLVLLFVKINIIDVHKVENQLKKQTYTAEKDVTRYYTAKSTIDKFYSFINSKNKKAVLNILSNDYVEKNKLTVENVDSKISFDKTNLTYTSGLMCSKMIGEGIYSYLVSGEDSEFTFDEHLDSSNGKNDKKYYEVILDGNTFLFTITPIEENYFKENCDGK